MKAKAKGIFIACAASALAPVGCSRAKAPEAPKHYSTPVRSESYSSGPEQFKVEEGEWIPFNVRFHIREGVGVQEAFETALKMASRRFDFVFTDRPACYARSAWQSAPPGKGGASAYAPIRMYIKGDPKHGVLNYRLDVQAKGDKAVSMALDGWVAEMLQEIESALEDADEVAAGK